MPLQLCFDTIAAKSANVQVGCFFRICLAYSAVFRERSRSEFRDCWEITFAKSLFMMEIRVASGGSAVYLDSNCKKVDTLNPSWD